MRTWGGQAGGNGIKKPRQPKPAGFVGFWLLSCLASSARLIHLPTIRVSSVVLAEAIAFVWPLAAYDAATPLQCLFVQRAPSDLVVMATAESPSQVPFFAAFDGTSTLGPKFR